MDEERIARTMLELVAARGAAKSICPSEVARQLEPGAWRQRMGAVRAVAARLAAQGRIDITRRGLKLDPTEPLRGAVRLRLPAR